MIERSELPIKDRAERYMKFYATLRVSSTGTGMLVCSVLDALSPQGSKDAAQKLNELITRHEQAGCVKENGYLMVFGKGAPFRHL